MLCPLISHINLFCLYITIYSIIIGLYVGLQSCYNKHYIYFHSENQTCINRFLSHDLLCFTFINSVYVSKCHIFKLNSCRWNTEKVILFQHRILISILNQGYSLRLKVTSWKISAYTFSFRYLVVQIFDNGKERDKEYLMWKCVLMCGK